MATWYLTAMYTAGYKFNAALCSIYIYIQNLFDCKHMLLHV